MQHALTLTEQRAEEGEQRAHHARRQGDGRARL